MRCWAGSTSWFSNAGTSLTEDLLEIEPEAWHSRLRLNLTSHYLAHPRRPAGHDPGRRRQPIVTVSSVNALWCIGEFGYSAAKAGLIQLTKNIAVTYGPQGIRANVICPGTIATESGAAYWDQKAGARRSSSSGIPLRRLGRPEDVAPWPSSSPPTSRASSPAPRWSSTAA